MERCQHSTQGWAVPELKGLCWGWGVKLAAASELLETSCPAGSLLPSWRLTARYLLHLCISLCPLRWWDLLSVLLSKSSQRQDTRVFATRYAGKTSWGLEVGREEEKKTKESPPSVELKPVVMLCLAEFPHCAVLGSCSPLADALPRAMRSVLQR